MLGLLSVSATASLRAALLERFGYATSAAFVALSVCQFHLPFYWSRSLPNTLALVLTTRGFGCWVRGCGFAEAAAAQRPACVAQLRQAIGLLTAAAVIFRCDVVILLAMCCLSALIFAPRLSILQLLTTGLTWGLRCAPAPPLPEHEPC